MVSWVVRGWIVVEWRESCVVGCGCFTAEGGQMRPLTSQLDDVSTH